MIFSPFPTPSYEAFSRIMLMTLSSRMDDDSRRQYLGVLLSLPRKSSLVSQLE